MLRSFVANLDIFGKNAASDSGFKKYHNTEKKWSWRSLSLKNTTKQFFLL